MELLPEGLFTGLVLVVIRTTALVLASPTLGIGTGFSGHKIALILAVSGLLYFVSGHPVSDANALTLGVMALREVLIGLFLGMLLQVTLVAVHVAGEMIGTEMGMRMARQVDPSTGIPTTLVASVYENLYLLAFLAMDGHHWLLRALGDSFERAPIGRLRLAPELSTTLQAMFSELFAAGLVFAAPVLVFLTLVSVLIGLLSRAVPTLNVMEIGFTLRVVVALAIMYLFAPLLEPAMRNLHYRFVGWLERGLQVLEV